MLQHVLISPSAPTNYIEMFVCVCVCVCVPVCVCVYLSVCVCQQLQSLTFTSWPDLHPTHLANLVHTHTYQLKCSCTGSPRPHFFSQANEPASSTKFLILIAGLEFQDLIKLRRIAE